MAVCSWKWAGARAFHRPRVVHLARSTELNDARDHPGVIRSKLQESAHFLALGVSEAKWEQVCLAIGLGGLGISDPHIVQPAARAADLINSHMNGTASVGVPPDVLLCPAPDFHATLARLQAQLGPNMDPLAGWIDGTTTLVSATTDHTTQRCPSGVRGFRAAERSGPPAASSMPPPPPASSGHTPTCPLEGHELENAGNPGHVGEEGRGQPATPLAQREGGLLLPAVQEVAPPRSLVKASHCTLDTASANAVVFSRG